MSSLAIGIIVLASLFIGSLIGFFIRRLLRAHHLSAESKDVIKLGTGLIGTMAALVLGLLVSSTKGAYDTQKAELTQLSAKIILLDRALAFLGPQAMEAREQLKIAAERMLEIFWQPSLQSPSASSVSPNNKLYDAILNLSPQGEAGQTIKNQAATLAVDIAQTRWLLRQQSGSSISTVFLVILVFWLTVTFISFGLFAPFNGTVVFTLALCSFS